MNPKILKLRGELEKNKGKISDLQGRNRELEKQMEATAPLAPDGTLRVDASVPERAEYEQQIETLQDGKRTLYERYLMGEIDLNTYKGGKSYVRRAASENEKRLCRSIGTGKAEAGRAGSAGQAQGSVQSDFRC